MEDTAETEEVSSMISLRLKVSIKQFIYKQAIKVRLQYIISHGWPRITQNLMHGTILFTNAFVFISM